MGIVSCSISVVCVSLAIVVASLFHPTYSPPVPFLRVLAAQQAQFREDAYPLLGATLPCIHVSAIYCSCELWKHG